jgi:hypothetical protein
VTATRELVFPDAVEHAPDLFDRDPQLEQVQEALLRPARRTVVLFGGRLVGKTSLLNVLAQWAEADASYLVIRLAHAGTRDDFMAEIVHGIHERVGADRATARELFGQDGIFQTTTVARFVRVVQDLAARARGMRFLLCVDELDSFLQGCGEETARQILGLVLHLTEQAKLPIRFLFTMSRIPVQIRDSYGSPFLNQATIIELRPWSAGQTRAFTEWLLDGRLQLDAAAHAAAYAAAGGHPYFTKALLRALLTAHPADPPAAAPSPAMVLAAAGAAVRSREVGVALSNLAGVYLPAGAVEVLDRVAASPGGLAAGSLRDLPVTDELLETLADAGLLAHADRRYLLRLGMWKLWRDIRRYREQPGRLARLAALTRLATLGRAFRWPGGRTVRIGLLSALVLLLALAFGPGLLFPSQQRNFFACGGAASGLRLTVSYPAYVSIGDEHELRVEVANQSEQADPVDGTVVVRFPSRAGEDVDVPEHDDNALRFDRLRPGEQKSLVVGFTPIQPTGWWPDRGAEVPVRLEINAVGASCLDRSWSLPVAPLPYLRKLQRGALGLVLLLPAPMVIEAVVRRIGSHRDARGRERAAADPAGDRR